MKLTKWFPADSRPLRNGVYQRLLGYQRLSGEFIAFSYWDGEGWGVAEKYPNLAYVNRGGIYSDRKSPWRGLLEKPE